MPKTRRVLKLRTFQVGQPPRRGEGLRIGVTRRPPRGIPRARWRPDHYFDVWLPVVAPSEALLRRMRGGLDDAGVRRRFFAAYERELAAPPARQAVDLLAAVARLAPISIGCFCADEAHCHRSVLKRVIEAHAETQTR